jgi:hypothetical protein
MATYTLSSSAGTINEGSNVTILLTTTDLPNGTLVPYSITGSGIDGLDFVGNISLTGNFRIIDNTARLLLTSVRDNKTELDEAFTLRLTGTGNDESVSVTITDTSKTASNTLGKFYITADKLNIREGQDARFNIRATGITAGTVVPYTLFGIQQDDLLVGNVSGLMTFASSNVAGEVTANVLVALAEDFKTEGSESIVILIFPDFLYTLELSSTITVQDNSINVDPFYRIFYDKRTVVEGGNVTIFLEAENVPAGTSVPWAIAATRGDITPSDFEGLDSLTGFWPPLTANATANVSSFVLTTRDDFVFEQTEVIYITIPEIGVSGGPIDIIDSGNTFLISDASYTGNVLVEFLDQAILQANLGSVSISKPYWADTTGLLSENMVLQGKTPNATDESLAFYHPFSYVIRTATSIEEWRDTIKNILHPAGLTIFSEINNETKPEDIISLGVKVVDEIESEINIEITADEPGVYASNTRIDILGDIRASSVSIPI